MARAKEKTSTTAKAKPPAEAPEVVADGLDELSDEELAAKVAERYPDYDPAMIPIAIAEKRADVIADLRGNTATDDTTSSEDTGDDSTAEPAPERHPIAEAPTADVDAEFPTEWHRDAYIAALEREVEGAKRRVEEMKEFGVATHVLADAKQLVKNAEAELARLSGGGAD